MDPIFIIGFMCSGKTTFGRALAQKTGLEFIDLDEFIEKKEGKSIAEIFRNSGENGFREIERRNLLEVLGKKNCIIACGGGTPCFFDNIDKINESGISVFLSVSMEKLLSRLIEGHEKRPLVANKTKEEIEEIISRQLETRNPFYNQAKIHWSGERLDTLEEIDENVRLFLKRFPIKKI